ncbi:MAG: hypothetical protein QOC62_1272 [Mycobacterium sp.]|nr:hypothetical protein [Mycobacterium sp.]
MARVNGFVNISRANHLDLRLPRSQGSPAGRRPPARRRLGRRCLGRAHRFARGCRCPVDRDRLVGVLGFAACFVSCVTCHHDTVVMHGDLTPVESTSHSPSSSARSWIDCRFDGRKPLAEELGDRAGRWPHDSAMISLPHRVTAGGPCLFSGVEAALRDPWVVPGRWIVLRGAEAIGPGATAPVDRALHTATSSRRRAVTM